MFPGTIAEHRRQLSAGADVLFVAFLVVRDVRPALQGIFTEPNALENRVHAGAVKVFAAVARASEGEVFRGEPEMFGGAGFDERYRLKRFHRRAREREPFWIPVAVKQFSIMVNYRDVDVVGAFDVSPAVHIDCFSCRHEHLPLKTFSIKNYSMSGSAETRAANH
jgi:hypothetical protein